MEFATQAQERRRVLRHASLRDDLNALVLLLPRITDHWDAHKSRLIKRVKVAQPGTKRLFQTFQLFLCLTKGRFIVQPFEAATNPAPTQPIPSTHIAERLNAQALPKFPDDCQKLLFERARLLFDNLYSFSCFGIIQYCRASTFGFIIKSVSFILLESAPAKN